MVYKNNSLNNTASEDFLVTTATAGTDRALSVTNTDNSAAASAAHVQVTVGGSTSTGDPYINFLVTGAGTFSAGVDNSDSDKFKISNNSSLGTSDVLAITPGANGNLVVTTDGTGCSIFGTGSTLAISAGNYCKLAVAQSVVGGSLYEEINNNDNTNAASNSSLNVVVGGTSGGDPSLYFGIPGGTEWNVGIDNSDTDSFKINYGVGAGPSTGTTIMKSTNVGEITFPAQPAFLAYLSAPASNVTGDGTQYVPVFDVEVYDQNADYNNGTGIFTAPVTGRYTFSSTIYLSELSASNTSGAITFAASNRVMFCAYSNYGAVRSSGNTLMVNMKTDVDMDAGDTCNCSVAVAGGTKIVDIQGQATTDILCWFSGSLFA